MKRILFALLLVLAAPSYAVDTYNITDVETLTGTAAITTGTINGTTIGNTNPAPGTFTTATITKPVLTVQALTSSATINWNMASSTMATLTLTNSATMATPTNIPTGGSAALKITQGGVGSYLITWGSIFKWAGGVAPSLSTGVGAVDVVTCNTFAGTELYCAFLPGLQ